MADFDLNRLYPILEAFAGQGRPALLPALQSAQRQFGYLSEPVAAEIGRCLGVPLADVYGVIEFYSLLYNEPTAETVIQVCDDPICALDGSQAVLTALCRHMQVEPGRVSSDGRFKVERVACLGLCAQAPAVLAGEKPVGHAISTRPDQILSGNGDWQAEHVGGSLQILTANCRQSGSTSLEAYRAGGGYTGLRRALSMDPKAVTAEVQASGLLGRGGAAFPTGLKWEAVFNHSAKKKYVVCNADESEPGTFKDRLLLEKDPHRTLEGMLIAAYSTGAQHGYIYIRGEYAGALTSFHQAVADARQAGLLGENILDSGFDFEIEIRQGAGAYICGEETALFESIEGKRGFPRMKPPFPTTHGLFGQPTVVNNVETLCNIPFILTEGAAVYRQIGTARSTGPKLFCVSGDVAQPGLYEIPFGFTLRELLFDLAGGIRRGKKLGAVLLGGAAGVFATQDDLEVHLTFEDLRAAGLVLGSGAVMVFDETRDLRDVLERVARFFADESCGKCYPCQIGTRRQHEILARLAQGQPFNGDDLRLADVGWTMTDASLCGLGQTAATAVLSAMQRWPELFRPTNGN